MAPLRLVPVNEENKRIALALHVAPGQEHMVESVEECCEEADRIALWRPVMIYDDQTPVGFAMYGFWPREGEHGRLWLDRFFIDGRYQHRGYATRALTVILPYITAEYGCKEVYLSVYEDNRIAIDLYKKFGFSFNGELDRNGERVMVAVFPA